jgi:hypothetical protein
MMISLNPQCTLDVTRIQAKGRALSLQKMVFFHQVKGQLSVRDPIAGRLPRLIQTFNLRVHFAEYSILKR